jgi:hypothetical protein
MDQSTEKFVSQGDNTATLQKKEEKPKQPRSDTEFSFKVSEKSLTF